MSETVEETEQKQSFTVLLKNQRKRLFSVLSEIIGFAEEKRMLKGNSDKNKQAWSRICISAVEAYGTLLKTSENEEILERLEQLEE